MVKQMLMGMADLVLLTLQNLLKVMEQEETLVQIKMWIMELVEEEM